MRPPWTVDRASVCTCVRRASACPPRVRASLYRACGRARALAHSLVSIALLLACSSGHSCCFCASVLRSAATCALPVEMGTHAGEMTHAPIHTHGTQSHNSSSCFATAHHSFALSLADEAVAWSSGHTGHRRPHGRWRTAFPLPSLLLIA